MLSSASLPSTSSSRTSPELYQTASFQRFSVPALSDTVSEFTNSNQVDPDSLFKFITENTKECKYYDATHVPPPTASNACFHMIHINVRSLQKNHDDLINFLSSC